MAAFFICSPHKHFRPLARYQHYELQNKKRLKMTRRYETINRSAHVNLDQVLMFDSNWSRVLLMCQILLVIVKAASSDWFFVPKGGLQNKFIAPTQYLF